MVHARLKLKALFFLTCSFANFVWLCYCNVYLISPSFLAFRWFFFIFLGF
uniref:Uncharacterized protein n=2 Tax=Rhizophora mucronata TaxID=61149 RepID=A0A2P2KNM1_RHIMU